MNSRCIGLLVLLILTLAPSAKADQAGSVDRLFRGLGIPGGVVIAVQDERIVFERAYGWADVEQRRPMTTDAVFWMSSLTKPVTAITLLRMQARGLIDLDAPVSSRPTGPLFPSRIDSTTTFREILSHTSETTDRTSFMYSGSRFNFVFGAFGTTDALRDAVVGNVLQPAGMTRALPGYGAPGYDHLREAVVTSYGRDEDGRLIRNDGATAFDTMYPSANLLASAYDLAALIGALGDGRLLGPDALHQMSMTPRSSSGTPSPYGLGWFVSDIGGRRLVWAYGYGDSDSSLLIWCPSRRAALIILANSPDLSRVAQLGYGDLRRTPALDLMLQGFRTLFDLRGLEEEGEMELTRLSSTFYGQGERDVDDRVRSGLATLRAASPRVLERPSLATLDLLSRFSDPSLASVTRDQIRELLYAYPGHPLVHASAARWFRLRGEHEIAREHLRQTTQEASAYEQRTVRLAALQLAGETMDRVAARELCWQVVLAGHRAGVAGPDIDQAWRCLATHPSVNQTNIQ